MFCENCGSKIPEGSIFCENCGTRVADSPAPGSAGPAGTPPVPGVGPAGFSPAGTGPVRPSAPASGPARPSSNGKKPMNPLPIIISAVAALIIVGIIAALVITNVIKGKGKDIADADATESVSEEYDSSETVAETKDNEGYEDSSEEIKPEPEEPSIETDEKEAKADSEDSDDSGNDPDTQDSEENSKGSVDSELLKHAEEMSTDEDAYATEFDWFIGMILDTNSGSESVVTDPSQVMQIYKDAPVLNGGWKCYMCSDKDEYFDNGERYMHADIDTDGHDFKITLRWGYLQVFDGGESKKEEGTEVMTGAWDPEMGTVTASSDLGEIIFDCFYESTDNGEQYAWGKFRWNSGETDNIALMRGPRGY